MKKSGLFSSIVLLWFLTSFIGQSFGQLNQKQYKFHNNHANTIAKDLHLEFDGNVSWPGGAPPQVLLPPPPAPPGPAPFPEASGNGTKHVDLATGFTGAGVPFCNSVVITLNYLGNNIPEVKHWWWTTLGQIGPTMDDDNNRLGPKHPTGNEKTKGCYEFSGYVPSTGNGQIWVTVDTTLYKFLMPAGLSGSMMAHHFADFINSIPFAAVDTVIDNRVVIFVLSFLGDENIPDLITSIVPDSTMPVIFCYGDCGSNIPTTTEWGLIILGILLLGTGTVYIIRRRNANIPV